MERLTSRNWKTLVPDIFYNRLAELEDKLESGQLLELPFPKQDYAYHIIKGSTKFGKIRWFKRKITWSSLIVGIAYHGNDGLYFQNSEQAEAKLKELKGRLSK